MFNSDRRSFQSAPFLIVAVLLSCGSLDAQERPTAPQNLAWAQEFLWTFYPEIKDHKYRMMTMENLPFDVPATEFGNLNINVGEAPPGTIMGIAGAGYLGPKPPKDLKAGPIYARQFVTASFGFDKPGLLLSFAAEGPAVGNSEAYDAVKALVESHPEWTEVQAIAALEKAGASFGPTKREKFMKSLPVDRLDVLFGKITIGSEEFESVLEDRSPPYVLLHWSVKMTAKRPDGDQRTYRLIFEPFKGALISMEAVSR